MSLSEQSIAKVYYIKLSFFPLGGKKVKKLITTADITKIIDKNEFERVLRKAFALYLNENLIVKRKSNKHRSFVPLTDAKDYDALKRSLRIKDTVKVAVQLESDDVSAKLDDAADSMMTDESAVEQPLLQGELKRLEISKLIEKFEELIKFNTSNIRQSMSQGESTPDSDNSQDFRIDFDQLFNIDKFTNELVMEFANKVEDFSELITRTINEKLNFEELLAKFQAMSTMSVQQPPQEQQPKSNVIHYNVYCDGCSHVNDVAITGIRYKCSICKDFDLCEDCENIETETHKLSHPLIKIKQPLTSEMKYQMFETATDFFKPLSNVQIDIFSDSEFMELKSKVEKLDDLVNHFRKNLKLGNSLSLSDIVSFYKMYVSEYGSEFTKPVVRKEKVDITSDPKFIEFRNKSKLLDILVDHFKENIQLGDSFTTSDIVDFYKFYVSEYISEFTKNGVKQGDNTNRNYKIDRICCKIIPKCNIVALDVFNESDKTIPKDSFIKFKFRDGETLEFKAVFHPCLPFRKRQYNFNLNESSRSIEDFTSIEKLISVSIVNESADFDFQTYHMVDGEYFLKEKVLPPQINNSSSTDISMSSTVIMPKLPVSNGNDESMIITKEREASPEPDFVEIDEDVNVSMTEYEDDEDDSTKSLDEGYEILSTSGYNSE